MLEMLSGQKLQDFEFFWPWRTYSLDYHFELDMLRQATNLTCQFRAAKEH